jgi:phosphate-selective porin OprO/OprP
VRYRSRPESHLAPTFVDTGTLRSAQNSLVSGVELAHFRGPWLLMSEVLLADVRGTDSATLWGGYASLSRFLSDDAQPYDRSTGRLARFEPTETFSLSRRTFGVLRAAARVSYLDLSQGAVDGGRETNLTADLTWFLNHYLSLSFEYGFAAIRDRPDGGNLHFAQTRLQIDFF